VLSGTLDLKSIKFEKKSAFGIVMGTSILELKYSTDRLLHHPVHSYCILIMLTNTAETQGLETRTACMQESWRCMVVLHVDGRYSMRKVR